MIFDYLIKENKEAFINKVIQISEFLIIRPEWLMIVMWFETAGTLNHRIVNCQKGDDPNPLKRLLKRAIGLIQFMPSTAKCLGTTSLNLYNMSNVEQLEFVKKYLTPYRGKMKSLTDVYMVVFFPAAVGKPDSFIIETNKLKASVIAKQNPVFDINRDQKILKSEVTNALVRRVPKDYLKYAV
jgi:hypothetical protein